MIARLLLLAATPAAVLASSSTYYYYYYYDDDDSSAYTLAQASGLGYAAAYFFGLIVTCYFLDIFGLFDNHVRDLSKDAYFSFDRNKRIVGRISDEYKKSKQALAKGKRASISHNDRESIIDEIRSSSSKELDKEIKKEANCFVRCIHVLFCGCKWIQRLFWIDDDPWSSEFTASLLENKSYYGCEPKFDGLILSEWWLGFEYRLPRGCLEDFFFHFYNTNPIASMFLCTRGHPISRRARRAAFISQNTLAFFLVCIWGKLCYQFCGDNAAKTQVYGSLVNVLLISPISIFVYYSFVFLLTMPCLAKYSDYSCVKCFIETTKMLFLPLGTVSILSLWGASAFYLPGDQSGLNSLGTFIYSVHVVTTANDLKDSFTQYMTGANYFKLELDLFCYKLPLLTLGKWFYEYAISQGIIITDIDKTPGCCYDGTKSEEVYSKEVQCFVARHFLFFKFTYICATHPEDINDPKLHVRLDTEDEAMMKEQAELETGDVFSASRSAVKTWPKFFFATIFGKIEKNLVNNKAYYGEDELYEVELTETNQESNAV